MIMAAAVFLSSAGLTVWVLNKSQLSPQRERPALCELRHECERLRGALVQAGWQTEQLDEWASAPAGEQVAALQCYEAMQQLFQEQCATLPPVHCVCVHWGDEPSATQQATQELECPCLRALDCEDTRADATIRQMVHVAQWTPLLREALEPYIGFDG